MLTEFERASLRLQAFEMLEKWGQEDAAGKFKEWGFDDRMKNAALLVDWAEGTPPAEQKKTDIPFHV